MLQERVHNVVVSYKRYIYKNILYHSIEYEKLVKRNNSIVRLTDGVFMQITAIIIVQSINYNRTECIITGNVFDVLPKNPLCFDRQLNVTSKQFFTIGSLTNRVICVYPCMLAAKCVLVPMGARISVLLISHFNRLDSD